MRRNCTNSFGLFLHQPFVISFAKLNHENVKKHTSPPPPKKKKENSVKNYNINKTIESTYLHPTINQVGSN